MRKPKKDPREARLKRIFNLSLADDEKIEEYQGRVCGVCKRPPKPGRRLAVDHRHSDGLIRGKLDWACNRAIAHFRDNPELLLAAAEYLKNPPATVALGAPRYGLVGRVGTKKQVKLIRKIKKAQEKENARIAKAVQSDFTVFDAGGPPNVREK